ncbi:MAG TPA: outer membrane protein assembly factor BamE [Xanthomonadales bacterium]|nr:outer membrane protein assembly factor BamE [Xanthomonadales bacterium]
MSTRIYHKKRLFSGLLLALLACSACGLIYKQNIQQGNALEEEDLQQLYTGMNKRQVLFVLGSPSIQDPFVQKRWDYVQTYSRRGEPMVQRTVTLRFENDLLAEIIGVDQTPSALVDEEESPGAGDASSPSPAAAAVAANPGADSPREEPRAEESPKPVAEVQGIGMPSAQERTLNDETAEEETADE